MRILWSANAPWSKTGYGVQAGHLLPRFQALGHTVGMFAWYGLAGGKIQLGDIPIYPCGLDPYGNDMSPGHAKDFHADLVASLIDVWVMDPALGRRTSELCGQWVPWLAWFPVDHAPVSPAILERVAAVDYPVQYSQFGMRAVADMGGPLCRYVPHGVDVDTFRPDDQHAARARLGFPQEAFLVSMVAANKGYPPRKGFPEQLQAFARFRQRHPEALLYLHSQTGEKMGGVDFAHILHTLGVPPTAVMMVDQYQQHNGIPEAVMADIYRASDVLLAASYSEGFGVPILEAQACGTAVVTNEGTSMTELTVNGIAAPSRQKFWSQIGGWWDTPDVEHITAALETIYGWDTAHRAAMSRLGVAWAREGYSWDVCVRDYWAPLLTEIEQAIAERREQDAAPVLAGVSA